jgi:hypothetical protein
MIREIVNAKFVQPRLRKTCLAVMSGLCGNFVGIHRQVEVEPACMLPAQQLFTIFDAGMRFQRTAGSCGCNTKLLIPFRRVLAVHNVICRFAARWGTTCESYH